MIQERLKRIRLALEKLNPDHPDYIEPEYIPIPDPPKKKQRKKKKKSQHQKQRIPIPSPSSRAIALPLVLEKQQEQDKNINEEKKDVPSASSSSESSEDEEERQTPQQEQEEKGQPILPVMPVAKTPTGSRAKLHSHHHPPHRIAPRYDLKAHYAKVPPEAVLHVAVDVLEKTLNARAQRNQDPLPAFIKETSLEHQNAMKPFLGKLDKHLKATAELVSEVQKVGGMLDEMYQEDNALMEDIERIREMATTLVSSQTNQEDQCDQATQVNDSSLQKANKLTTTFFRQERNLKVVIERLGYEYNVGGAELMKKKLENEQMAKLNEALQRVYGIKKELRKPPNPPDQAEQAFKFAIKSSHLSQARCEERLKLLTKSMTELETATKTCANHVNPIAKWIRKSSRDIESKIMENHEDLKDLIDFVTEETEADDEKSVNEVVKQIARAQQASRELIVEHRRIAAELTRKST